MLVKILEYDTSDARSVSQAEHDLIEYLNSGWEIKGQSESDGFIHYTLVCGKPSPYDVIRHHAYGVATC